MTDSSRRTSPGKTLDYLWAALACLATTLLATPLLSVIDPPNIIMLFLLTVALVAVNLGGGPAVAAAFLSVVLFDFFFVPPRFSLAVADAQYVITFAVMLVVALIIGRLTARLRAEADDASRRQAESHALYETARALAGAIAVEQVAEIARRFLTDRLGTTATLYLPDAADHLQALSAGGPPPAESAHVRAAYEKGEAVTTVGADTGYAPALLLPLVSPVRSRGVLALAADEAGKIFSPERRPLLEAVASLVAIAVERLHYVDVAQQATLNVESERLRNALLSAVSHDLRTPLTVLVGLADSLAAGTLPAPQGETAVALRDQALRLSDLVHNLLDMARLQMGRMQLRREWQPLDEIVGSSLKGVEARLAGRSVRVDLAPDLPLLEFDAVLMERVLCNLLENAAKYAPAGEIAIEARREGARVAVAVLDEGPGLPAGGEGQLFGLFERGRAEDAATGAGLGLAICRVIVEAHGGSISAANRPEGGARFAFTLPVGNPPEVEAEPDE